HTADVLRELGALARIAPEWSDAAIEAMARIADAAPEPPPWSEVLRLLDEKLLVLDRDGRVLLGEGPGELARRTLSTGKAQPARRVNQTWEEAAYPLFASGQLAGAAEIARDRCDAERQGAELARTERELAAAQARLASAVHMRSLGEVAAG